MGTCTSIARHRQKQQRHNQATSKNPIALDIKSPPPLPPLPLTAFPNQQLQYPHSLFTDFDLFSASLAKPIFHQTDTNSLIQLYSSYTNTNNNNNNNQSSITNRMSSSSITHIPPQIPVPKTRLPVYHQSKLQQPTTTVTLRPKDVTSTVIPNNPTGSTRPMSITNRAPPPTTMQTRFGFIPRPTAPGVQEIRTSSYVSRSRSISPTSTISVNSSSSSSLVSQRLAKAQTIAKPTPTRSIPSSSTTNDTSKPRVLISPRARDVSISKSAVKPTLQTSTTASRMRSRTPSRTSTTSPSSSVTSPLPSSAPTSSSSSSQPMATTKSDVDAIRDRYKIQKRMNFFTRRTPISTANGSPIAGSIKSSEPLIMNKEKRQPSSNLSSTNNSIKNNDSKPITPPQIPLSHGDSIYAKVSSSSTHPPTSAHLSQGSKHRQRAIRMISASSVISNVLNQDALLEDDNCSLKSEDLMCDYDDTLTLDSLSKNGQTDSCSSASLTTETNQKHVTTTIPSTPTKPTVPCYQSVSKENRSTKCSPPTNEKTNGGLRESLDELNRLSNRMENGIDNEHNRKLPARSLSLKPPPSYLPPLDDAEQITMDIESYRQVMKDVMVVKTVLHQLDRLLKNSDGATMTDSMIGSFHEFHDSVVTSRRYSSSTTDGNLRSSIDENSSYDDLLKEIIALRKEKEQDKQTIKLLQEQMYKYSSQTNS